MTLKEISADLLRLAVEVERLAAEKASLPTSGERLLVPLSKGALPLVLTYLASISPAKKTSTEITDALPQLRKTSVSPALTRLYRMGQIEREVHALTNQGAPWYAWWVAERK